MLISRLFKFVLALLLGLLEMVVRFLWLLTPIGVHMLFLQLRSKADTLPALTGYFDPNSTWQMVYDGVVIVNTNPGALRQKALNTKKWFIKTKWYWLILIVLTTVAILGYIAYKLH